MLMWISLVVSSSFVWSIGLEFLEVAGRFEIYIYCFFFEGQKTKAQFAYIMPSMMKRVVFAASESTKTLLNSSPPVMLGIHHSGSIRWLVACIQSTKFFNERATLMEDVKVKEFAENASLALIAEASC